MATITLRPQADGGKSYRVEIRLKGHPPQRATFARLTDARRWAQATEAAMREGRHFATSEAQRHTLGELVDRYTREVLPHKSPKSLAVQGPQLAWWREQLGERALADITPALVAEYRDKLAGTVSVRRKAPLSPATVNRHLAALSHAFTVGVKEWGWCEINPLARVSKPREPRGRVRFLSDSERERLLSACKASRSPDLYPAVILALSTGARSQEILGARWGQVDFARRVLTLFETKNGETRLLPLAGPALELLRERSRVRRIDTDMIFPGRLHPHKPVDLRTPFENALKAAGIEDFHWHDLRHTAASYLAMNGASLAEIAEILGHRTLSMVKRYAHLSEAHVAGVVERMNARFLGDAK